MAKATNGKLDITFDLNNITAKEMTIFFKAARENDNDALAGVFSKVVSRCPEEWGDPNEAETFANLPYFTVFKQLIKEFVAEANEAQKN